LFIDNVQAMNTNFLCFRA